MTDLDAYVDSFGDETGYLDWASFGPLAPSVLADASANAELLASGRRSSIDLVVDNKTGACAVVAELLGAPV